MKARCLFLWLAALLFAAMARADITIETTHYNLATSGQGSASLDAFSDSISGTRPGPAAGANQFVQETASGTSSNFADPDFEGMARVTVQHDAFGADPKRFIASNEASLFFTKPLGSTASRTSAFGATGTASYFNEITFRLDAPSTVRFTSSADLFGEYRILGPVDPETGAFDLSGNLPSSLGAYSATGFVAIRLLDAGGGVLLNFRSEVYGGREGGSPVLALGPGTYRLEFSGLITLASDPVPVDVDARAGLDEANSFEFSVGSSSFVTVVAAPVPQFIWEGTSSTGFNNPLNWAAGAVPGAADAVEFSRAGLKNVEMAPGQAVQTAGLSAKSGSDTWVDLNGGSWAVGGALGVNGSQWEMVRGTLTAGGPVSVAGTGARFTVDGAGALLSTPGSGAVGIGGGSPFLQVRRGGKADFADRVVTVGAGGILQVAGEEGEDSRIDGGRYVVGGEEAYLIAIDRDRPRGQVSLLDDHLAARRDVDGPAARIELPLRPDGGSFQMDSGAEGGVTALTVTGSMLTGAGSVDISSSLLEVDGPLSLAMIPGEEGELRVSGPGSALIAWEETSIGFEGRGAVSVENGGTAQFIKGTAVAFLDEEGDYSRLIVTGEGSEVFASDLILGRGALLFVTQGGAFHAAAEGQKFVVSGGEAYFFITPSNLGDVELAGDDTSHLAISSGAQVTALSVDLTDGDVSISDPDSALITPSFVMNGGTLSGRGKLVGDLIQNGGAIEPGTSPGTLTIEGDLQQTGGRIVLEIGGPTPGTQHDQLVITGDFESTGGVIELVFVDGFAPQAGQRFSLLDIEGGASGTPAIVVSGLQPGWQFEAARDPATGVLGVHSLSQGVPLSTPPATALRIQTYSITDVVGGGPGKTIACTVTGPAHAAVILQASTDLKEWAPLASATLDASGAATLSADDPTAPPSGKFYRVITP